MRCDICHKNDATISYTVVVGGKKTELHLCEECAAKKGLVKASSSMDIKKLMSLGPDEQEIKKLICPRCGLTYKEFREQAKFGCSDCYKAFEEKIIPLFQRIHGSNQHTGKSARIGFEEDKNEIKIFKLKSRLKKVIESESYEEAAKIRDEIKKWEARN